MKKSDNRIVDDLSEEEYNDYEQNPENWEEVTSNTNEYYSDLMGINDNE